MFPKLQKLTLKQHKESQDDQQIKQSSKLIKLHPKLIQSTNKIRTNPKAIPHSAPASSLSSSSSSVFYNYRIFPGNNTRVLINALRRRKWWRPYSEEKSNSCNLIWEMYRNPKRYESKRYRRIVLNHIQNNNSLVTKKGLYLSLRSYCQEKNIDLSTIVPLTFYLPDPSRNDPNSDYDAFLQYNQLHDPESNLVWILKPSHCSNRGFGIMVVRGFQEVLSTIGTNDPNSHTNNPAPAPPPQHNQDSLPDNDEEYDQNINSSTQQPTQPSSSSLSRKGWIVQSYLQSPLLISGRKFDIRCYVLLVLLPTGQFQAYFYQEGYIRTSSKRYHLNNLSDREIHLTNDAIQKKSKLYGKHENGNKLSYEELEMTLLSQYPHLSTEFPNGIVSNFFIPQIKKQIIYSIQAAKNQLKNSSIKKSFELLGYDFMIDSNFKSYLIEVNSNPCLEFACPLLEELIDSMVEGVFQIAVDQLCPPPPPPSSHHQQIKTEMNVNKWEVLDLSEKED